jgi:multicomponent Na+:H+ antiporter subunit E
VKRSLVPATWLVVFWLALWEDLSIGNLVGGVLVAVAVLAVARPGAGEGQARFRPLAAVRFFGWFLWKLLEASAIVAWEVATPTNVINEGIVAVPIHGTSRLVTTIVANAITLTPGTLTIDIRTNPTVLYVHVLHLRTIEEVRREVHKLEHLAVLAFGSDEAVAALADDPVFAAPDARKEPRP